MHQNTPPPQKVAIELQYIAHWRDGPQAQVVFPGNLGFGPKGQNPSCPRWAGG